jgi:tetratricopeptide (TPR) repeat protein
VAENPRIEELRRRVQADPASIAFAALAEEFRRIGRYDDAIETCRTGLQRHPAYLSARVTLGRALIETGDFDAARAELETVLRSAPENIAALRGIEQINERLGHSTEMHPDLAAMANEPVRLASPPVPERPPPDVARDSAEPVEGPPRAAEPTLDLAAFDLPLASTTAESEPAHEPFDIFAAALGTPAASGQAQPESEFVVPEDTPISLELPPLTFESATIAFEAPVMTEPDPNVAATLIRLERLLGAIHTARHA